MSLIERWTCSRCGADHAGFTVCQSCGASREVATGESEVERLRRQLAGAVEAIERSHAILADAIARDSWTKGAAINAESILRHALKRAGGQ